MILNLDELIAKINEGVKIEDLGIEVRKRMPIMEKMYLIEGYKDNEINSIGLAEECTSIIDNMKKINYGMKEIMTVSTVISNYSNINVICEGFYDKLMDSGIYDYVIKEIEPMDMWQFTDLLESNIEQNIKLYNSSMAVISRLLIELINKIPDEKTMKKVIKDIKDIDPKKMDELKKMVNRIIK